MVLEECGRLPLCAIYYNNRVNCDAGKKIMGQLMLNDCSILMVSVLFGFHTMLEM